jgi:hypothetical protein
MTVLGGEFLTKIGPMLGRGSYGEVVPGFHIKTGVPVAVKAFSSCSKDVMIKDGLAGFTLRAWLLLVPTFSQPAAPRECGNVGLVVWLRN